MEDFIEQKIKEMDEFVGVVSFKKGTDNYNRLKKILIETYNKGINDIDEFILDGLVEGD